MFRPEQRELQRLRFRQGQMLRSEDFRDQQTIEAQLRAWHNRALHTAYGVAKDLLDGLEVTSDGQQVIVKRGLAYDCFGRELRLGQEQSLPLPNLPDTQEALYLVIRSLQAGAGGQAVACCEQDGRTIETCLPSSTVVGASDAELVWLPVKGFSIRDGVPLQKALLNTTKTEVELDTNFTVQQARPLARPRIASGATIPGATDWNVWDVKRDKKTNLINTVFSFQIKIDTSSAGFATRPAYFAELQGQLSFLDEKTGVQTIGLSLGHIDEAASNGFVFRFFITAYQVAVGKKPQPVSDLREFLRQQNAYVSWIGIESSASNREDS